MFRDVNHLLLLVNVGSCPWVCCGHVVTPWPTVFKLCSLKVFYTRCWIGETVKRQEVLPQRTLNVWHLKPPRPLGSTPNGPSIFFLFTTRLAEIFDNSILKAVYCRLTGAAFSLQATSFHSWALIQKRIKNLSYRGFFFSSAFHILHTLTQLYYTT